MRRKKEEQELKNGLSARCHHVGQVHAAVVLPLRYASLSRLEKKEKAKRDKEKLKEGKEVKKEKEDKEEPTKKERKRVCY